MLDGKDITPLLRSADAPSPHQVLHWESGRQSAVRKGPWKLHGVQESFALYNIDQDPGESQDLSAENPHVVAELKQSLAEWRKTRATQ